MDPENLCKFKLLYENPKQATCVHNPRSTETGLPNVGAGCGRHPNCIHGPYKWTKSLPLFKTTKMLEEKNNVSKKWPKYICTHECAQPTVNRDWTAKCQSWLWPASKLYTWPVHMDKIIVFVQNNKNLGGKK